MRIRLTPLRVRLALLARLPLPGLALVHGQPKPKTRPADKEANKSAWTNDEALAQLELHPRDPYLQYVAMQTARRENKLDAAIAVVERAVSRGRQPDRPDRRSQVDLFSTFTSALAVQESLQPGPDQVARLLRPHRRRVVAGQQAVHPRRPRCRRGRTGEEQRQAHRRRTAAHALIRGRSANWNEVLKEYRLGWAENNRQACLNNQGPIASAGRAILTAQADGKEASAADLGKEARQLADKFNAVHFYCPEGGRYELSKDKGCSCTVHGSPPSPLQPFAPNDGTGPGQLLKNFSGLTVTLTFLEDGLHAVVVVERK